MSKHIERSMIGLTILLFGAMLVGFDRIALAEFNLDQNTNSSKTTQNNNATPQRRPAKRTPAKPTAPTTADPSMPAANVTTEAPAAEPAPPAPARNRTNQQTPATDEATTPQMLAAEQTDLSGTYTGTFVCDVAGINGETTLTINGNEFTTADGKSGRIVATTTRGYTAVVLQPNDATGTTPTILSLRARKSGNRLTLLPVPGSTSSCTFTPTATTAKSRRTRGVRQAAPVPAATGTEVSNPAEATPATPDSAGPTPPSPAPKSTRGRPKSKTSTGNPPSPKPSPTPPQQ